MPMLCSPKWRPNPKQNSRLPKSKAKQWSYTRLYNKMNKCCAQGHLVRTKSKTNLAKKERRRSEEVKRMFWRIMCSSVMTNLNLRSKWMKDKSLRLSSINSLWNRERNCKKMCRQRPWIVCKLFWKVNLSQLSASNRFLVNPSTTLITSAYPAWNLLSSM